MGLLVSVIYRVTHVNTVLLRCMNSEQTGRTLGPKRQQQMNCLEQKPSGTESGLDESLVEVVYPGYSVAVRNIEDESYPYYVLRASSSVIRLRSLTKTNGWYF